MLPLVGVIIGIYCCVRCLELTLTARRRWESPGAATFMRAVAIVAGLAIAFFTLSLWVSGSGMQPP